VQRRSTTLLTRLALALLVALGFVAPVATVEADRVVQAVRAGPPTVEAQDSSVLALVWPEAHLAVRDPDRAQYARADQRASLRYLLHQAWLL
jgi:parvulin-like peptidyl-prolyl isomerase